MGEDMQQYLYESSDEEVSIIYRMNCWKIYIIVLILMLGYHFQQRYNVISHNFIQQNFV